MYVKSDSLTDIVYYEIVFDAAFEEYYMPDFTDHLSKIKLNLHTRLNTLMGGETISWVDKEDRYLKTLRICSLSEYYEDGACQMCAGSGEYSKEP